MLTFKGIILHNTVSEEYATRVTVQSKNIINHIFSTNNIGVCDPVRVEIILLSNQWLVTLKYISLNNFMK